MVSSTATGDAATQTGSQPDDSAAQAGYQTTSLVESLSGTQVVTWEGDGLSMGDDGVLLVALDPGHGGDDQGTSGFGLIESDINWTICEACAAYLEQVDGVEVLVTRDQDQNLEIKERAIVAAGAGADILVSLHINYNEEDSRVSGAYVYYPCEKSSYLREETSLPGLEVTGDIMGELSSLGLVANGVITETMRVGDYGKDADHYAYPDDTSGISDYYGIIRWPRMYGLAAVLVEHAFLSNSSDAALLSDPLFLQALGEADARGVLEAYGFEVADVTS